MQGPTASAQFFDLLQRNGEAPALFRADGEVSYRELLTSVAAWEARLAADGFGAGSVVGVHGEFSLDTIAMMFALIRTRAILVPLSTRIEDELKRYQEIAAIEGTYRFQADGAVELARSASPIPRPLVETFRARGNPGLIVFTSGSTGEPKGILHDCDQVIGKFLVPRTSWRTVLFLMMDHFGGFNTLLSTFAYGGTAVCLTDRMPRTVLEVVARSGATLLPTTPTFLNLIIASGAHRGLDLSSVRLVTYGTEVMPEYTLNRLGAIFPAAKFKQTYGLSETGVLRSSSKTDDSLWMRIGGDGFETKVVDDMLWIRAASNMVGYLNAPSPFDADGWLCTGDRVEVEGQFLRVLGRESDLINVGGQKVFPAEVEDVLLLAENVVEAAVFGVKHELMGNVVCANVALEKPEPSAELVRRLRVHCIQHLARYKVPIRFSIIPVEDLRGERFKKRRRAEP